MVLIPSKSINLTLLKTLLLILTLFLAGFLTAQETTVYDTIFHPEDAIKYELIKTSGSLKNGLKIGLWRSWYNNGQIMAQGEYAILLNENIQIVNHEDCNECLVNMDSVRKELKSAYSIESGKWETYYKNGKLMQSGSYLPEYTIDITWSEMIDNDGVIKNVYSLPIYLHGLETGDWFYYDETGMLTEKTTFVRGVPVKK